MLKRTPLYEAHCQAHAALVDFGGWEMPLHYGSQLNEHHFVRQNAGMFDVSHMTVTDIEGDNARDFLRYLLANDIDKMASPGKALYSCMLNETGGVMDDLIVYWLGPKAYRLVTNAATREKDRSWILQHAKPFQVTIQPQDALTILAVQGPHARAKVEAYYPQIQEKLKALTPFSFYADAQRFIACTGYTGEEGYELILSAEEIREIWQYLCKEGVHPCGLGARDTLRLEAGMNLYGQDMDEQTSPYAANLAWTVAIKSSDRHFMGRESLEKEMAEGCKEKLIGLVLHDRGVLRHGQKVYLDNAEIGEITSGSFSPTLGRAIALARVKTLEFNKCEVDIRGKRLAAHVAKPPFARHGKALIEL